MAIPDTELPSRNNDPALRIRASPSWSVSLVRFPLLSGVPRLMLCCVMIQTHKSEVGSNPIHPSIRVLLIVEMFMTQRRTHNNTA